MMATMITTMRTTVAHLRLVVDQALELWNNLDMNIETQSLALLEMVKSIGLLIGRRLPR
jgi:hypothetical protein